ncbi:MAG: hypothetical protein VKL39_23265 [Leptolyngbyaceae bacterium]|nr:hypothetical protein [Leptolyngbyaceae bacterium]
MQTKTHAHTLDPVRSFWSGAHDMGALPTDYQSWTAQKKQEFLWENRIVKSQYDALPPLRKIDVTGLFLTALRKKMDRQSDEVPANWNKAIHAHGSVAKITFVPEPNTPFTGMFARAEYGLLRVSLTGDPGDRGVAPGLAIKFFVDGRHSENVSALVSLTGQGQNYNVFANEFSNIVPVINQIGPRLINLIFRRVTRYPTKLSLQDWGSVTQSGETVAHPHVPARLFWVPNPAIQFPETPPHDFREDLATVPAGSPLFSVYAVDADAADTQTLADDRPNSQCIGHIETTSEFVASFYGDSQLFFRHQRFKNR